MTMTISASTMTAPQWTDSKAALLSLTKAQTSATRADLKANADAKYLELTQAVQEQRELMSRRGDIDRETIDRYQARIRDMGEAVEILKATGGILKAGNLLHVFGTGGGDAIVAHATLAWAIDGGAGDDAIAVSGTMAWRIDGGSGDDSVSVAARHTHSVEGGAGDDAISVAGRTVHWVEGGDGADAIAVDAPRIAGVSGGDGNDAIAVHGTQVFRVDGGAGADAISVVAHHALGVKGGDGNDVITVTALHAGVWGGAGDDVLRVDADTVSLEFQAGDGNDLVHFADGVDATITVRGSLASTPDDYSINEGEDGSITVSFGTGDSITLANAGQAASIDLWFVGSGMVRIAGAPEDNRPDGNVDPGAYDLVLAGSFRPDGQDIGGILNTTA